jgi:hypothetical protein
MYVPMSPDTALSLELPMSVRLGIADAIVVFGRIEQQTIEIWWILEQADFNRKLHRAQRPVTKNFLEMIDAIENVGGEEFTAVKQALQQLAKERNLIVHGAWAMADGTPWVVWHKFLEDDDSVVGEHFADIRFERFMKIGEHLLDTLKQFHNMLISRG